MTSNFKYQLDKSSRKFRCPNCGQKRFVLYIDIDDKEYLAESVGRCDREDRCAYHYTPKQFFTDNPGWVSTDQPQLMAAGMRHEAAMQPVQFLPFNVFEKSMADFFRSNFFEGLSRLFTTPLAKAVCEQYFIGSSKSGDTAFWQVDINGKIRQCKVMQYVSDTLKRNKETGALFVGKKILADQEANLQQCFFGEYQLSITELADKPVAIVESEKTAVIATLYFPDFIWLATGGKHGAKWTETNVAKVLSGRKVILFPDLGAYEAWELKGKLIQSIVACQLTISDILETSATEAEKENGLDLADYLVTKDEKFGWALSDHGYPLFWDFPSVQVSSHLNNWPAENENQFAAAGQSESVVIV